RAFVSPPGTGGRKISLAPSPQPEGSTDQPQGYGRQPAAGAATAVKERRSDGATKGVNVFPFVATSLRRSVALPAALQSPPRTSPACSAQTTSSAPHRSRRARAP